MTTQALKALEPEIASTQEKRRYIWSNSDGSADPSCEVFLVEAEKLVGLGIQHHGLVIIKTPEEWHKCAREAYTGGSGDGVRAEYCLQCHAAATLRNWIDRGWAVLDDDMKIVPASLALPAMEENPND